MKIIRVGVDLAKNVFQVHGVDRNEKPVWKRKLKRDEWIKVLLEKTEPGCEIGMEACGGAHHWARKLEAQGYVRSLLVHGARSVILHAKNKNDRLSQWVRRIANERHPNVAIVAMANKTARIAWALIRKGTDYHPELAAV